MIDLVAELRQLSNDLVSVSPQSAAIKGKHPQMLDAAAHRIAALTAEVERLKKAARAFKSDVSDVAGTGFLNWRLLLDAHCDRFAALLDQPKGGPDA